MDRSIASKQVFDRDFEDSKKDYLRGKTKDDPNVKEMSSRLGQGDEEAEGALSKAHIRAAKKRDELFKLKRDLGMKKGGMVRSSASKRADGCAVRGKTKGKMV